MRITLTAYDSKDIGRLVMLAFQHIAAVSKDALQRLCVGNVIHIDTCLHIILATLVVSQCLLPLAITIEALNLDCIFTCGHIADHLIETGSRPGAEALNALACIFEDVHWRRFPTIDTAIECWVGDEAGDVVLTRNGRNTLHQLENFSTQGNLCISNILVGQAACCQLLTKIVTNSIVGRCI